MNLYKFTNSVLIHNRKLKLFHFQTAWNGSSSSFLPSPSHGVISPYSYRWWERWWFYWLSTATCSLSVTCMSNDSAIWIFNKRGIILFLILLLHCICSPFQQKWHNHLDSFLLINLIINSFSVTHYATLTENPSITAKTFLLFLMFLPFLYLC